MSKLLGNFSLHRREHILRFRCQCGSGRLLIQLVTEEGNRLPFGSDSFFVELCYKLHGVTRLLRLVAGLSFGSSYEFRSAWEDIARINKAGIMFSYVFPLIINAKTWCMGDSKTLP
ncbi:hypothetical protein V6N13_131171 [Hibiscus sabdariffa]